MNQALEQEFREKTLSKEQAAALVQSGQGALVLPVLLCQECEQVVDLCNRGRFPIPLFRFDFVQAFQDGGDEPAAEIETTDNGEK